MGSTSSSPKRDPRWQGVIVDFLQSSYYTELQREAQFLFRKNNFAFFDQFINKKRAEIVDKKKEELKEQAKIIYQVKPEDDPVMADLKKRHFNVASTISIEALEEIEELLLQDGSNFFHLIAAQLADAIDAEKLYTKYFNSFDFIKQQLTKRYKKDGKSDEEILKKLEVLEHQYLSYNNDSRCFSMPVRLLIVKTRIKNSVSLQVGRALSFISKGVHLRYGGLHLAVQIGFLVFHWLDDSLVHIDVLSSKNVVAMIYPQHPSNMCFLREVSISNKQNSPLMKIAKLVVDFNTNKQYNKLSVNCQLFATQLLEAACKPIKWDSKGPINQYVTALSKGQDKAPFHFWAYNKNAGTVLEHQLATFEEFAKWCADNQIHEWKKSKVRLERETYDLCKALWRAKQLRQASGFSASKYSSAPSDNTEEIIEQLDKFFVQDQIGVLSDNGYTIGQLVQI